MIVKPTRMELLLTKKKLKLATKGHKLLKEKRDALVMEFFSTLREIKQFRNEIAGSIKTAQNSLYKAEMLQGTIDIERFSLISSGLNIEFSSRNVMGIEIPVVSNIDVKHDWYGYFDSTPDLDNAVVMYRKLLPNLIRLAEKQLALQKFAEEIRKTKRKVNSLEFLIIPHLEGVRDLITFKLEELERENFSRLKKIKKITAK